MYLNEKMIKNGRVEENNHILFSSFYFVIFLPLKHPVDYRYVV